MTGCREKESNTPDFSGYTKIAELATKECNYHNVAEIHNDGTDILFGINVGYKKAWFEYDCKVTLGIDVSKVKIEGPDQNNVVTIYIPEAQVIGLPVVDENTFSDIYKDTGLLTGIETSVQSKAYEIAQEEMKRSIEPDTDLMNQAKEQAKTPLGGYVQRIGASMNQNYEIKFVDAI